MTNLSTYAKALLAKIHDEGTWIKPHDPWTSARRQAALDELLAAGLISVAGRVETVVSCYVPAGTKSLRREQYPSIHKLIERERELKVPIEALSNYALEQRASDAQLRARLIHHAIEEYPSIWGDDKLAIKRMQKNRAAYSAEARLFLFALIERGLGTT